MNNMQNSVLQASALDLQERLTDGSLTSVTLTTLLLDQIDRHNQRGLKLNAVISLAPRDKVLAIARSPDSERSAGVTRSKLHGVPVIIKVVIFQLVCEYRSRLNLPQDAIVTDISLGMPTTVGSHVFAALKAKRNATLVDKVLPCNHCLGDQELR